MAAGPPLPLVGDEAETTCADGTVRRLCSFDSAASTAPLPAVLARVEEFLPSYSSVHRGASHKSRASTAAYEAARDATLAFAGRERSDDVVVFCRNTTEALNLLAFRLRLSPDDTVVTTVVEHHANLLPWRRYARCRYVECERDGTFGLDAVVAALDATPRPRLVSVTGGSNVTGFLPPIEEIAAAAHARAIPVVVDGAQLAPHRPLPTSVDFVAFSGHKLYAPFGTGALLGPRSAFAEGEPFLVGGGAVTYVDLDEAWWTSPPEREEAGSPNVVGAVALHAAIDQLAAVGWPSLVAHDLEIARALRAGLSAVDGVRLLGPPLQTETLPVVTFEVAGVHHSLVAARLAHEAAIAVRHGGFCAHPYTARLLGLGPEEMAAHREAVRRGDRRKIPGAVRASGGINTTLDDVERLCTAVAAVAAGGDSPVRYEQDPSTGAFSPAADSGR